MIVIQSSDDEEKKLKRREKNRVAAQRSRKRQTQRADELHEVCNLHIMLNIKDVDLVSFICHVQTYVGNCGLALQNISNARSCI